MTRYTNFLHSTTSAVCRHARSTLSTLAFMISLGATQSGLAMQTVLTFDDIGSGIEVTTQYQSIGVVASGVLAVAAIATPWQQANSGLNVAYSPTGGMVFGMDSSILDNVQAISAYISGEPSIGIWAYDKDGALVGQTATPGATDNLLVSLTSSGNPITTFVIHDGGSSFTIDTLTITSTGAVPEPTTAWLLGLGLLGLIGVARRKDDVSAG